MIKRLTIAAVAVLMAGGVAACPGESASKDKTVGSEPNMTKAPAKFVKGTKANKQAASGKLGVEPGELAVKPKA
jgi:Flp pilus assembly protein TadD